MSPKSINSGEAEKSSSIANITGLPESQVDPRPTPPRWRALLPAWVRGLIWVEQATSFDAFLSYSWKGESAIAPAIQSIIQSFLRPWYKPRALNIFRDLSSLAAGSSLQDALRKKLDQSQHLIVLASSSAATSDGMEFEASYWFSKPRQGTVLIIATEPGATTWEIIRDRMLPPSIRANLHSPPLWIDLSHLCDRIRKKASDHEKGQITEALSQLILAFYPSRTWSELRGEERRLRTRALVLVWTAIAALSVTTGGAIRQALQAMRQTEVARIATKSAVESATEAKKQEGIARDRLTLAENRLTDLISAEGRRALIDADYDRALLFLSEAYARRPDDDAVQFMSVAAIRNAPRSLRTNDVGERVDFLAFSPDSKRVLTVTDGPSQVWISDVQTGAPLVRLQTPPIAFPSRRVVQTPKIKNDLTLMGPMNGPMMALFDSAEYQRPFFSVLGARFFARGTRVLTWGGELVVYDARTGRHLADFAAGPGLGRILGADLDRSERLLVTYDDNGEVAVWDLPSHKLLRMLDIDREPGAEKRAVAGFDPTGERIVVAAWDSKVRIWNSQKLDTPSTVLESGTRKIVWTEFAPPDGERLVTTSAGGLTELWYLNRDRPKPVSLPSTDGQRITRAHFTRDGQRIVAIGGKTAGVWGGLTAPFLHSLAHNCSIEDLDFSPDGSLLVTACATDDASAKLWNVVTGELIATFRVAEDDTPRTARFSPDGARIATGSGFGRFTARIWSAHPDTLRFAEQARGRDKVFLQAARLTADGRALVRITHQMMETTVIADGKVKSRIKLPYGPNAAAVSGDGRTAVTASSAFARRAVFHTIDPAGGRIQATHLASISGQVETLSFSPDGKTLALIARNYNPDAQIIELWDTSTWTRRHAIVPPAKPSSTSEIAWSPDSAFTAFELDADERQGQADGTVLLVETKTGSVLRNLQGENPVFSPDSTRVVLASRSLADETSPRFEATLYPVRGSGAAVVLGDLKHPHEDWIDAIAFSPTDARIATGSQDQTVKIWDTKTGALLATLGEAPVIGGRKQPYVRMVAWSPNGQLLASADDEGGVRVWDAMRHVLLFRMTDFYTSKDIQKLFEFTRDGRSLVLVGDEWFGAFETGLSRPEPAIVRQAAEMLVSPQVRALVSLGGERVAKRGASETGGRSAMASAATPPIAPQSEELSAVTQLVAATIESLTSIRGWTSPAQRGELWTPSASTSCAEMSEAQRVARDVMMEDASLSKDRLAEEMAGWATAFRTMSRRSALDAETRKTLIRRAATLQQVIKPPLEKAVAGVQLLRQHVAHTAATLEVTREPSCEQQADVLYLMIKLAEPTGRLAQAAQLQEILEHLLAALKG